MDWTKVDGRSLIDVIDDITGLNGWYALGSVALSSSDDDRLRPLVDLLDALRGGELIVKAIRYQSGGWSTSEPVTLPAAFWRLANFRISRGAESPCVIEELDEEREVYFADPRLHLAAPVTASNGPRERSPGAERMMRVRQKLLQSGALRPDMDFKEQHQLVLAELGIRDDPPRGFGYETFRSKIASRK